MVAEKKEPDGVVNDGVSSGGERAEVVRHFIYASVQQTFSVISVKSGRDGEKKETPLKKQLLPLLRKMLKVLSVLFRKQRKKKELKEERSGYN